MSAWTVIGHTELGSAAASITFMNSGDISSSYTDLLLTFSLRASSIGNTPTIQFNNSSTGYSLRRLRGDGSATDSYTESSQSAYNGYTHVTTSGVTASTFSNGQIYIPNYRSSVAKSFSVDVVTENNATQAFQIIAAGLWSGTDPITKITITAPSGNDFVANSSATLYGITKGSSGGVTVS